MIIYEKMHHYEHEYVWNVWTFRKEESKYMSQIYAVGEITNIQWRGYNHDEITVSVKYPEITGLGHNIISDIIYIRCNPNLKIPYEIGDMIMVYGKLHQCHDWYVKKTGIEPRFVTANKVVVVNHLKYNEWETSKQWIEKLLKENKFDKLWNLQIEAHRNGTPTMSECVSIIDKEMNDDLQTTKQKIMDQFNNNQGE